MHDILAKERELEKASIYSVKQVNVSRQWWHSIGQEGEPPALITVEQSPFLDGQGRVFGDEPKAPKPRTRTPSLPPPPSSPTEEQLRYIKQHYSSSPAAPVLNTQTMEAAAAAELVHEVRANAADDHGGVMTRDWAANYAKSPTFGTLWRQASDAQADALLYPEGARVLGTRCISTENSVFPSPWSWNKCSHTTTCITPP